MTDTMIREIRGVLSLGPPRRWRVPIVRTEAAKGEGVAELAEKIAEHREHIEAEGTLEERRARNLRNEVLELAAARLRRRLEASVADDHPRSRPCSTAWSAGSSTRPAPPRSCWRVAMAEQKARKQVKAPRGMAEPPPLPSLDEAVRWDGSAIDGMGSRPIGPRRRHPRRRRGRRAALGR